jgi:hypothetical protein
MDLLGANTIVRPSPASVLYLEQRADLDHYLAAMEQLCAKANPPDQTADTLRAILCELDAEHSYVDSRTSVLE